MNDLKFILLNDKLSRRRCRSLARHRNDFYRFIDTQLKSERIEPDLGRAIETEIRVNGEKTAWAFLFDYGLKGKTIFGGFEV
jgi:hypothetical protein